MPVFISILNVVLDDCFIYNSIVISNTTGCPLSKLEQRYLNQTISRNTCKRQQNISGFRQHNNILFYCYFDDDMFRSLDHPQVIFTKLKNNVTCTVNNVHVIWETIWLTNIFKYIKNYIR